MFTRNLSNEGVYSVSGFAIGGLAHNIGLTNTLAEAAKIGRIVEQAYRYAANIQPNGFEGYALGSGITDFDICHAIEYCSRVVHNERIEEIVAEHIAKVEYEDEMPLEIGNNRWYGLARHEFYKKVHELKSQLM